MKVKSFLKTVLLIVLILMVLISAVLPASALVPAEELPEVSRWINGAAANSDGIFLADTWAIDNTGVSDYKYVLINQEGTEEMRVNNYPADITLSNFVYEKTHDVSFKLKVPKEIENEVTLTLENDFIEYTVSFNKSNSFSQIASFYPGEYNVTNVEAAGSDNTYSLSEAFTLYVADTNVEASLEIIKDVKAEGQNSESEGVLGIVKAIDSNGDLLWDTIKLLIILGVLFTGYLLIQRRRKKAEEINR